MKMYNISGYCKSYDDIDEVAFAGLFFINEFEELEEIYYIDDSDNQDKYLLRDLSFMKNLGKVMFETMKKHNFEDVEIIEDVIIDASYCDPEFRDSIIKIIKE